MLQRIDVAGISIDLYDVVNIIYIYVTYIYIMCHAKAYCQLSPHAWILTASNTKDGKRKSMRLVVAELFGISLVFHVLLMVFNKMFGLAFTNGNANYYGTLFTWTVVMTLLPYAFCASSLKTSDLLTPVLPLGLAISKLGCSFAGCCASFEMPSFYYNQRTDRYEFPIQLLEAVIALMIFQFTLKIRKKLKRPGFLFPIYMVVYAGCRFVTEFLRADSDKTVYFLNNYQLISLIAIIIGLFFMIVIDTFGEKIEEYSAKRFNHVIMQDTAEREKQK